MATFAENYTPFTAQDYDET